MNAYQLLAVEKSADERTVKRAYSELIKQYRPDTHPAEFSQIRVAYEELLYRISSAKQLEAHDEIASESVAKAHEVVDLSNITSPGQENQLLQLPQVERNLIKNLISQLELSAKTAREDEMQARYYEQAVVVDLLSLDQQMDYEQNLLYWILVTKNPSLLVFSAASSRYDWMKRKYEIAQFHGGIADVRLTALFQLAEFYQSALMKKNVFIKIDGEVQPRKKWLEDNFSMMEAQKLSYTWSRDTRNAEIISLQNRIIYFPHGAWQMFWVDAVVGSIMVVLGLLLMQKQSGAQILLWMGICFVFVPSLVRYINVKKNENKTICGVIYSYLNQLNITKVVSVYLMALMLSLMFSSKFAFFVFLSPLLFMFIFWLYEVLINIEIECVVLSKRLMHLIHWAIKFSIALKNKIKRSMGRVENSL